MVAFTYKHTTERSFDQFRSAEARARRSLLSKSFSRGAQTLEEATDSARVMAESLQRKGMLLRTPSNR